jgi:DNA-directed RNA polymerase specialized sigma24 family protein
MDRVESAEEQCLKEAAYWNRQRSVATERYGEAVAACKELGLSNARIARAVGKTETAIRTFLKRRI